MVRIRVPLLVVRARGMGGRGRVRWSTSRRSWTAPGTPRSQRRTRHRPPAAGVLLTHARVLDVQRGKWLADQTVLVVGDKIARGRAVGRARRLRRAPRSSTSPARRSSPASSTCTCTSAASTACSTIASGVTTVRDVGNDPDKLDDFKKRFDDGDRDRAAHGALRLHRGARREGGREQGDGRDRPRRPRPRSSSTRSASYEGIKIYNSVKTELVPVHREATRTPGACWSPATCRSHMLAQRGGAAPATTASSTSTCCSSTSSRRRRPTRATRRASRCRRQGRRLRSGGQAGRATSSRCCARKKTVVDADGRRVRGSDGRASPGRSSRASRHGRRRLPVQTRRLFLRGGLPITAGQAPDLSRVVGQDARAW